MHAVNGKYIDYRDWLNKTNPSSGTAKSITSSTKSKSNSNADKLELSLKNAQKKQGIIGWTWNRFKNITGLGLGSKDVNKTIEQYKNGETTYEAAAQTIEKYETKQNGIVNLAANIVSGFVTAAVTISTMGTGIAAGAALGGAVKAGIKITDRATNEIDGDAINTREIVKDFATGAVDGAMTVASAGIVKNGAVVYSMKEAFIEGAKAGAKAGAITGAVTGAADYTIEAATDEDVDFSVKGLAVSTLQNALAGGLIGGIANGASYGIGYKKASNFNANLNKNSQTAVDINSYVDAETGIKYKYDETTNTWIAQKKTD